MIPRLNDLVRPYQLGKLIVDYEKETIVVEGISAVGTTQIDLNQLGYSAIECDLLLNEVFDMGDLSAIRKFRDQHMKQFL